MTSEAPAADLSVGIDGPAAVPLLRLGPAYKFFETAIGVVAPQAIQSISERLLDGRYVIIIAVCDYVRLRATEREQQVLHALSSQYLEDIRGGVALLLLDLSNEGPQFDLEIFEALHAQLDEGCVPRDKVVFVCQNRRLAEDYAGAHGAGGLRFWTLDYFPLMIVDLFDRGRRNIDLAGYVPLNADADKIYNCLNSAPRWHRVVVFRWLQEKGLLADGVVSFHGTGPANPKGGEIDLSHPPPELMAALPHLVENLRAHLPIEPYRYDQSGDFGNVLSTTVPVDVYARSNLSIVNESDFFGARTERVTEKSIKAAAMGLPFVIVGQKNSIALMRSLGFRTFDEIIDHSYDNLDDIPRMEACLNAVDRVIERIRTDPRMWRHQARADGRHNIEHARAGLAAHFKDLTVDPILDEMRAFVFDTQSGREDLARNK